MERKNNKQTQKFRVHVSFLTLFDYQVANCAPSRPREDAGRVPGNPASSYLPSVVSSSRSKSHSRKPAGIDATFFFQDPPNEIGFRRVYRWSTACSVRPGGDLLRFLPSGGVDARGGPNDPDSEFASFFFLKKCHLNLPPTLVVLFVYLLSYFLWLTTTRNLSAVHTNVYASQKSDFYQSTMGSIQS